LFRIQNICLAVFLFNFIFTVPVCNQVSGNIHANKISRGTLFLKSELQKDSVCTVVGVGDLMLGSNFPDSSELPEKNGEGLFAGIKKYISSADIALGSLEGAILSTGGTQKICGNPNFCYFFRMPPNYAAQLEIAGFDLMNMANNHAFDFGAEGIDSTRNFLRHHDIAFSGIVGDSGCVIERGNVKYGYIAFSNYPCEYSMNNLIQAQILVSDLAKRSDVTIVSFHGGAEGADMSHVPKEHEIQFGTDLGDVYTFSHAVIDAGADIVFGHGPHVLRGIELYKSRFVAYSTGNFCTYGQINILGLCGISAIFKVKTENDGSFISGEIIPVVLAGHGVPVIDNNKLAIALIRKLSFEDFPDSPLSITDDGKVNLPDYLRMTRTPIDNHSLQEEMKYYVIAGSYWQKKNAETICEQLENCGYKAAILPAEFRGDLYKVYVREFDSKEKAKEFIDSEKTGNEKFWIYESVSEK
jgi:hypothetical protein